MAGRKGRAGIDWVEGFGNVILAMGSCARYCGAGWCVNPECRRCLVLAHSGEDGPRLLKKFDKGSE